MFYRKPMSVLNSAEIVAAADDHAAYEGHVDDAAMIGDDPWSVPRDVHRFLAWRLRDRPRIYISDFDPTPSTEGGPLNPNSYNLKVSPSLLTYNVFEQGSVNVPRELDMKREAGTVSIYVPADGYVLQPGRLYLGRTVEYTRSYNCVPRIDGRSSTGRLGVCVHLTAGLGDVGYEGTWTLEITCVHPVRIYPNAPLCQISYSPVNPGGLQYRGRYFKSVEAAPSRHHLGELRTPSAATRSEIEPC